MALITRAGAWCNGEVGYIAWDAERKIENCVGFMITRVHESGPDKGQRRILPTWVAFTDQNNPNWNEQDSSVWPIQRFEWRDLTLRKSRNTTAVRPIDFDVHYEVVPVSLVDGPGHAAIPASPTAPDKDEQGLPSFQGPRHQLFTIGEPTVTNSIRVTHTYGDKISASFTNGILSTQNLVKQLSDVNKAPSKKIMRDAASADKKTRIKGTQEKEQHLLKVLKQEIVKPDSKIRAFLTGDVFAFVSRLIERAEKERGEVYLALYELHDKALIALLLDAMKKGLIHIILTTAGNVNPNAKGTPKEKRKPVIWDTENDDPRRRLHAAGKKFKDRVIDRMFNSSARIGHNKFAVLVKGGKAVAVMTGSTNWTETGLCTQSNNTIIVDDENIAADYFAYWNRLKNDKLAPREPLSVKKAGTTIEGAKPNNNKQGAKIRTDNQAKAPVRKIDPATTGKAWFSPSTKQPVVPKKDPVRPVDLSEVYDRMDHADKAILFLTFLPGRSGVNNIIGEAAALADKAASIADKGVFVMGAISDPTALPNFVAPEKGAPKPKGIKLPPPAIWWPKGDKSRIAMVRAAAVRIPFGNLRPELLTAGHAIIHDKIIVIDPLDKARCTVITGSHNLGYKASYCNDENLLIIQGNRDLAISYAVHVIDLYDHYVMRARLEEKIRQDIMDGKLKSYEEAAAVAQPHGLLGLNADWQNKHFDHRPMSSLDYFLANTPTIPPVRHATAA